MQIIKFNNSNNFNEMIKEGLTIVDFSMDKWGACIEISKVLEIIKFEIPFINIIEVSLSENKEMVEKHGIKAFPTIYIYKDGELKEEVLGAHDIDTFDKYFSKYLY